MPKISGTLLASQLVEQRPSLKVLYISGYTDNAVINSGLLHHDVFFLQKPFTPGDLVAKVREVLESNGRRCGAGE